MSKTSGSDHAAGLIRAQLEELARLRNAGTRSPEFKAWRQHTLTVIQRIWPGDARRSDRFRKLPFSPPMLKADARAVREYYERGCGEAATLLRAYLEEIGRGLPAVPDSAPEAEQPGAPPMNRRDPIELPDDDAAAGADTTFEVETTELTRELRDLPPAGGDAGDEAAPGRPPVRGKPGIRPAAPSPHAQRDVTREPDDTPAEAGPPPASAPGQPVRDEETASLTEAFLRTSPVFSARSTREKADAPQRYTHLPARQVAALATELEALRVPAARREKTAAALLALAESIDEFGDPTWQSLRDALRVSTESPELARRAFPLLMPFLEAAA